MSPYITAAGRRHWRHRWTRWYAVGYRADGIVRMQQRHCVVCDKAKTRVT